MIFSCEGAAQHVHLSCVCQSVRGQNWISAYLIPFLLVYTPSHVMFRLCAFPLCPFMSLYYVPLCPFIMSLYVPLYPFMPLYTPVCPYMPLYAPVCPFTPFYISLQAFTCFYTLYKLSSYRDLVAGFVSFSVNKTIKIKKFLTAFLRHDDCYRANSVTKTMTWLNEYNSIFSENKQLI